MQCRDCSNFQSMGEFDLQASVSRSQTECENLESPVVGNVGKVDILGDLLKSNLKYGQVHEALNTCIRAYSSGFPDSNSQYLEILLDGVAKKARDKLYKNAKLSLLCSLCYGVLTDPVTLKCGHTFSKKCIVKAMKGDYFECVKCSKSYSCDYLIELRNNVIISTVLEKYWETKNSSIKKSVETSVQEQTQEKICDADMCFIANRSRKEPLSALVSESALFNSSSPMGYLRRGDLLVKLEKYEEALIAYLVCFTFDSKAMHARGKAIKLFEDMLKKCVSKQYLKTSADSAALKYSSLKQKKALTGSDGSLSSAESNDSFIFTEDDNSSSDDDTKDWSGIEWKECTGRSKLHRILEFFFDSVEKILDEKSVSQEIHVSGLDKQDFECPLCMRILWEPVTTPCGHSFCRFCLNRCLDHQPTCPLCKTSLAEFLAERVQSITVFLELAIKTLFPRDYEERKSVYMEEMEELSNAGKDPKHVIPLFVCTLAYPTVPCPLHVFEPRYRLMIRQCMESGSRQFGMCAYIDDNIAEFGTMLEIRDVQYFPDGRSVVDTIGSRRFRILKRGERDGYHTGAVEFLEDESLVGVNLESIKKLHDEVYKVSQAWFMRLPSDTKRQILLHFGPMPPVESNYLNSPNGPSWFWWMLAVLPLEPRSQLMILSMTSLPRRLNTLYRVLLHLQSSITT